MTEASVLHPALPAAPPAGLRQAQYQRLRGQIPFLYLLLAVNAFALAFTHRHVAPPVLTLWIPAGLILACLVRMAMWLRPVDVARYDTVWIERQLKRTTVLAMLLSVAFVAWALALGPYGGAYQQGHIAIFVAVTVLGVIFCLTHHPTAARLVCSAVIGTFLITCLAVGTEVVIAVAINIALVTAVLLKILHDSFDAFVKLEASKNALLAERRQAQQLGEENARLAATDVLTGLPNRRYFLSVLERTLEQAQPDQPFSIGLLDLDRFKPVNDTYGHAQGDRLLQALGDRIRALCPPGATVARLGGDEFGLLVPGAPAEAETLCDALRDAIRRPVSIGDISVAVGCSAGIATFPDAGTDAHMLFDRADFALYHAKRHGRGGMVRFSDALETLIRSEQALDATLQTARLEDELSVLFQPVMDRVGGRPFGIEALARWTSPRLGAVSPEMLIAAAERTGMTRAVTLTLFDKVLAAMARLPADMRVAFNLSALDLCDGRTIGELAQRIEAAGIRPARLMFEITETSLVSDMVTARAALERLRRGGARIALDDFGTGYSSLAALHQLPIDMVKVDRSFAARLNDAAGRRLLSGIRGLADALAIDCVLEGVETEAQLLAAQRIGFTLVQGFFLARPMPIEAILDLPALRPPLVSPARASSAA